MGRPIKKLVNLEVIETSGVDRAAHLHDGFLVMKSAESALPTKENNLSSVQEQIDSAVSKAVEGYDEKVAGLEAALEAAKNQAADLATKLEEIQAMQTGEETVEMEASIDEMPTEVAEAMEEMPEDVAKSVSELPAEQRDLFAKAFKAQSDEIRKERDIRLDSEAVSKSKETYKNVGIDHDVVAPALRRLTELNSELAKTVESVLLAAEAQMSESGLLKEFGTPTPITGSVIEEAKSLAKALVESGVVKTIEQGVERVLDTNPELAKRYAQEGAN